MVFRSTATALVGLLLAAPAWAAAGHPRRIDVREHRQAQRIRQGVQSGALTRGEASRLAADQAAVRAEERVYRRTGGLSAAESRDLEKDLDRTSREITRATHNDRTRGH
jgi:hypothetical protein